jgi:hypothetical protein
VRSTISQVLAKTEPAKEAKIKDSDAPANDDSAAATPAKDEEKTPAWRRMLGLR